LPTGMSIPLLRSTPTFTDAQRSEGRQGRLIDRLGHGTHMAGEQVADGTEVQTSPFMESGCVRRRICA
jgi:hypothetical protein